MKTERALNIDEIYQRVRNYDLVLTVDAPLADALNARVEKPVLGFFAATPMKLALSEITGKKRVDNRELFLEIIRKTDLGWKHAVYLLNNVVGCWKESGDPEGILGYPGFDTPETKAVIDILLGSTNPLSALTGYRVPEGVSVAVVAYHQFTELDRKILPRNYDRIDIFTEEETTLPPFSVFNSASEIIQTVLDNIDDPRDAAVVMHRQSPYRPLLESAFRTHDIPYMLPTEFRQDEDLRTFIGLLELALSPRGLKLKDVRPLLNHLKREVPIELDENLIADLDTEDIVELRGTLETVEKTDFEGAVKEFEALAGRPQHTLREHLDVLEMLDSPVNRENLNAFKYYLESFDITVEDKGRGVLIASPISSSYIDRSVVFYLGMDTSWSPEKTPYPWVRKEDFHHRFTTDFKILLQNGKERVFMVENKTMAEDITPSFHFQEFTTEPIEKFTDMDHVHYGKSPGEKREPFEREDMGIEPTVTETLSQSSLNTLAYCPKDHLFNTLKKTPDNVYFRKGNLLHQFAEFYLSHRDFVDSRSEDEFVEFMLSQLNPFMDPLERPINDTTFRIGIRNIKEYLEPVEGLHRPEGYIRLNRGENVFSNHFDMPLEDHATEMYFKNLDVGASGIVDLIRSEGHIVDYKTGKRETVGKIMQLSDIHLKDKKPRFQAKIYIAHHRTLVPGEVIDFTFFHILEDLREKVSGGGSLDKGLVRLRYYPEDFEDMIPGEEMYRLLTEGIDEKNDRMKTLGPLGYEGYRDFFKDKKLPEDLMELKDELTAYVRDATGLTFKYIETECGRILRDLGKFRKNNLFKGDIDEFQEFLAQQIVLDNRYKAEGYPVGDVDPDELDNRDMVIL